MSDMWKEVELQNKQVGTDANGTPVFHEYAVCRDCKKQWDLDKQRAKKRAEKANASARKKTGTPKACCPGAETSRERVGLRRSSAEGRTTMDLAHKKKWSFCSERCSHEKNSSQNNQNRLLKKKMYRLPKALTQKKKQLPKQP